MTDSYLGRTFGDFIVRARLGAGGGGEVYRAEQLALGREAVIKVLARRNELSPEAAERFLREARLASRLDHPFAAHVYSFGVEADGTLWIAMELVRGTPLNKLIAQAPIPLPRFLPLFDRLCEVLNAAHEQGIVHRDIKPANVMVLQRAGRLLPKLLDLGIARAAPQGAEIAAPPPTHRESAELALSELPLEVGTLSDSLAGRLTLSESMQLTQLGAVVGTPHYMAPEQWLNASGAGARADVYSLAILAYQSLTGRLPFEGTSLRALARAHGTQPLPPLGEGLPPALLEVLQKGAAKQADQRYETPLVFAAALRAASGMGVEPPSLPQLDEALRENVLSEAPQPIAESVALLDAARTPQQAVDAVAMVARVLVRYLGILALSARARIGAGASVDTDQVRALLARLREVGLSDEEWLELTCRLVRPFATKRDAHTFPELVAFCDGEPGKSGADLIGKLLPAPPAGATDGELVSDLAARVPRLGAALERASFLFDYALAVQRNEAERWMGTRRLRRLPQQVVSRPADGEVVVADAVGGTTSLAPLVQCIAPSGGAPEELFLLDGPGRHGARLVAWPSPYERQDPALWEWMVAQGLIAPGTGERLEEESRPYLGLTTFSTADADNYFGREKEAEAFANRLRRESFLAVVGPSGTGKSSFILAGVLPLLPPSWTPAVLRPGPTPLAALRARLAADQLPSPDRGGDALVQALGERTLVLVVDQFEELVTLCHEPAARLQFAATLLALSRHPSGRIKVVVTLRDDFLIKVQQLDPFRETLSSSLQLLGTPAPEDLQRVVTEPARRAGYQFDDSTLPSMMVAAVADYPGALALLSFTAAQLWDLRDRHLRLLRAKTYEALGGVGGALANHAEAVLSVFTGDELKLVREAFRHLLTAQGTRAVLSKKEALEVLGGGDVAQGVLDKLVAARLLVSFETLAGGDSIEIIHEALITAWPRLVGWQREDAESARLRDALRAAARQWEERGRPSGLLWRKETLAEYRLWRAHFPGHLTQLEEAFAQASLADEARGRLIRRSLVSAAFILLSIGLVVIFRAYQRADASSEEATQRLQRLWQERARLALVSGRPDDALVFASAARQAGANNGPLNYTLASSADQLRGMISVVARGEGARTLAFSSRLQLVAILAPQEIIVVDLAASAVRFRKPLAAYSVAIDSKGGNILVSTYEGDLVTYSQQGELLGTQKVGERAHQLTYTSSGAVVAAVDGIVKVYEPDGGTLVIDKHAPNIKYFESQDGVGLLYAGLQRRPRNAYRRVAVYDGVRERLETAELSAPVVFAFAEGDTGVFLQFDGVLSRHDLKGGVSRWRTKAHAGVPTGLAVDLTRQLIVTSGADRSVRGFDLDSGVERFMNLDWTGSPTCLTTSRELGVSAVGLSSGPVYLLDNATGRTLWVHHGHLASVVGCAFWNNRLLTLSEDGSLRIWDAEVRHFRRLQGELDHLRGPVPTVHLVDGGVRFGAGPTLPDSDACLESNERGVWALANETSLVRLEWDGGAVEAQRFALEAPALNCMVSPSGKRILAFLEDGQTVHLRSDGGVVRYDQKLDNASTGTFLDDERVWVSSSSSGLVRVWDATTGELRAKVHAHTGYFTLTASGVPHRLLSMGYDRKLIEWEWVDGGLVRKRGLSGLREFPLNSRLIYEGRLVWIAFSTGDEVFDLDTGQPISSSMHGLRPAFGVRSYDDEQTYLGSDGAYAVPLPGPLTDSNRQRLLRCRLGVDALEVPRRVPPDDCFGVAP